MGGHQGMKVSVLIPTYNRRDYVVAAIESVLSQDFTDYEVIVVDDGSTDGTADLLRPYATTVRLIRTANQGPARARNVGMQAARGDYIAYLDSDDLYYPYKLGIQAALLDAFPDVGLVYTEFSGFSDDGFWDECHLRRYHASAYERGGLEYRQIFTEHRPLRDTFAADRLAALERWSDRAVYVGNIYDQYLFNTVVFTNSMMFRRSLLAQAGLQQKRFGMFHDLEFALRLCREAPTAFIDVPTYKLRYHTGQISTTRRPAGGKVAIRIQRDLLRVARHHLLRDRGYYASNRRRVDSQIARLCRAAAVPLMSFDAGTEHENRWYPVRARRYLDRSRVHGERQALLYALTYAPHLVRRIAFKLLDVGRGGAKALGK
jgi:glycosyltransferase involved in cell wall biosynthesis